MDTKVVFDQMGQSSLLARIRRAADQLERASDMELDLRGTPYELQVWNLLREIEAGETTSYGALAAKLGTRDARDLTVAISTNPITVLMPRHRALKKNGSISGYRWAALRKRVLLEPERLARVVESKNGFDAVLRQQTECRREDRILLSTRP